MRELVCNYAPVRFLPYRETGEFVNVGVVIYCPQIDFLDFTLEIRKRNRIRHFFPELDLGVFKKALAAFQEDLARRQRNTPLQVAGNLLNPQEAAGGIKEFKELVRPREALINFGELGTTTIEDPKEALKDLFGRFVLRQFATRKDYQENQMRLRLAGFLKEWKLRRFYKPARIGDETYNLHMPFVYAQDQKHSKILKPLHLDRENTVEIYEHGGLWVNRLNRLKQHGIDPAACIFTVALPQAHTKCLNVADEICEELKGAGARVVPFDDCQNLRKLATIKPSMVQKRK